jgi:outer membrane protein TolC
MRTVMAPGSFAVVVGISVGMAATAYAQGPQPPAPPGPAPVAPVPAARPPAASPATPVAPAAGAQPAPPGGPGAAAPSSVGPAPVVVSTGSEEATTPVEVPSDLVQANPGGLTADQAGMRASTTSWNAKAQEDNLRSAEARVDQAWAAYLPRLSGKFSYQRLSEFTPPKIALVSLNPQQLAQAEMALTKPVADALATGFGFPLVFNEWSLVGTLTVPISDYFFSIGQRYSAATHSEDAARWNVIGARASALTDGKIEYYTWLRNRGAVVVTVQSLNDQKTHLRDARNQFAVGNASKADVLRAETAVSSAELALEQAENLSALTEKQLRVAMHLPEDQPILPGEDLAVTLPSFQGNLKQMTVEAMSARAEIKSADANAEAAEKQAAAAKAARYPVLVASGDGIFANPNSRVFPQTNAWFGTWDAGASLSWSPNDILIANGSVSDYEAQAAAIKANQNTTRDTIEVEVQQDWQGVREADFAVESSAREVASAEEAYRVQQELFNNGRGTSATLTDAEGDLTRARLTQLNARANARIARIRLDHALGRDIQPASAGATGPTGPRN